jgi:hypothetical protein
MSEYEMTDQLVLETGPRGEQLIHNLLKNGPGSEVIHQGKVPLRKFLEYVAPLYRGQYSQLFGLVPAGMTLRSVFQRNGTIVFLLEVAPGIRTLRWLRDDSPAQFGRGATYRDVRIALPWQYFFVSLDTDANLRGSQSVYFLNQPMTSLSQSLGECHYYNCSVNAYAVHCWICVQYLASQLPSQYDPTPLDRACMFVEWFFASSFNASSEHHEREGSFWTKNRNTLGDSRVATIDAWEAATKERPEFALEVPWKSSLTAEKIFEELTCTHECTSTTLRTMEDVVAAFRECSVW